MTPRLSVVVPYYNVADYIAECLDSLRRQTLGDFEVEFLGTRKLNDQVLQTAAIRGVGLTTVSGG